MLNKTTKYSNFHCWKKKKILFTTFLHKNFESFIVKNYIIQNIENTFLYAIVTHAWLEYYQKL